MKIASTLAILGLFTVMGSAQTINFSDPLTSANNYWNYESDGSEIAPTFSSAGMTFTGIGSGDNDTVSLIMPSTDGTIPSSFSGDFNAQINYGIPSSNGGITFTVGLNGIEYADSNGSGVELYIFGGSQSINFGNTGTIDISDVDGTVTESINDTPVFTDPSPSDVSSLIDFSVNLSDGQSVTLSNFSVESTPEPSTFALAGLSGLGLMVVRKKFSKSK